MPRDRRADLIGGHLPLPCDPATGRRRRDQRLAALPIGPVFDRAMDRKLHRTAEPEDDLDRVADVLHRTDPRQQADPQRPLRPGRRRRGRVGEPFGEIGGDADVGGDAPHGATDVVPLEVARRLPGEPRMEPGEPGGEAEQPLLRRLDPQGARGELAARREHPAEPRGSPAEPAHDQRQDRERRVEETVQIDRVGPDIPDQAGHGRQATVGGGSVKHRRPVDIAPAPERYPGERLPRSQVVVAGEDPEVDLVAELVDHVEQRPQRPTGAERRPIVAGEDEDDRSAWWRFHRPDRSRGGGGRSWRSRGDGRGRKPWRPDRDPIGSAS